MKTLLINPPGHQKGAWAKRSMYPMTLLFLSSYLIKNGCDATILDLSASDDPADELRRFLADNTYGIVGLTSITENRFIVCDLVAEARRLLPEALIVVGGNHFCFTAEEALKAVPEIDVVVRFDGEMTLLELVRVREHGGNLAGVKGISYRMGDEIVNNPDRPAEMDLDKFLITEEALDHIVFPHGSYSPFVALPNYENEGVPAISISVGRGCPGNCIFCIYNRKAYRTRTAQSVIEEVKQKLSKHNCRTFFFHDPYMGKRRSFVVEFCDLLKRERLDIQWYAEMRADMDMDLLERMHESGCISIEFGLETASGRVMKSISKGIAIEQVSRALEKCRELGIRTGIFVMFSLPDEREEDALQTIRFVESYRDVIHVCNAGVTCIYPGTKLETMAREAGILPAGFSWYDRSYRNSLPGLCHDATPVWHEDLRPEFIRNCLAKVDFWNLGRGSFFRRVFPRLLPLFLDWSKGGLQNKKRWIRRCGKTVLARTAQLMRRRG